MLLHSEQVFYSRENWEKYVNQLEKITLEGETVADILQKNFYRVIECLSAKKKKYGVFFSGGIDSTIISYILKERNRDFICITTGFRGCQDIEWAKKVADYFEFELVIRYLDDNLLEKLLRTIAAMLPLDIVTAGVGVVTLQCALAAAELGISEVFTGLGSEEIFAGYHRHEKAEDLNKECWHGLRTIYTRDIVRDATLCKYASLTPSLPFLQPGIIIPAMSLPPEKKISHGYKKVIIREIAEKIGIPKEFAWRKKKAAQYGSSVIKNIHKLAKHKGFRYKKDYLDHIYYQINLEKNR